MNIEKYWREITELYEVVTPHLLRGLVHTKVSDGLHQTFKIQTTAGNFALKILDPWIVSQHGVEHWNRCEKIAQQFIELKIPSVNAIKNRDGKYVSKINNDYFLIYPWVEGRVLKSDDITVKHAEKIGRLLGMMHGLHCHPEQSEGSPSKAHVLPMEIPRFTRDDNCVLSHRDLDPKNIIWQNNDPVIIDWEYAGLITPTLDLLIVAFNFAGLSAGKIFDKKLFQSVLDGYKKITGKIPKFTQQNYIQYLTYCFDWLEFNFRRWIAEPKKRRKIETEISKCWRAIRWVNANFQHFINPRIDKIDRIEQ